ncbi:mtDNA inheritance, partitioning of the mitochondrial organelle [Maudiozyma exigua]|uniref:Protein DML1 n=1 Tax=Maudiozyma exigua TaxID=34358 RepID=A0A9P6WEV3_MAUEX|nr:mtDNA inheritance, partitioning of the mitochondrial organelle [Kazachstania exigua]
MQEIVTISVSQRANHLTTQFFNTQEQNLYNTDPAKSLDTTTFLNPSVDKISKTVSYYPRLLLWDAKNGNGSLGKYQYIPDTQDFHSTDPNDNISLANQHPLVHTHNRIERSKYQNALDNSEELPELTKENTKYWSDYNRLIYQPYTFNNLTNWYHDPETPNLPDFRGLMTQRFINLEQGVAEWDAQKNDFMDENLRVALEQCDTLEGFNLVTDMDSAWGSFTTSLLQELKDEIPKSSIFSWGFFEPDHLTSSKPKIDNKYQLKNVIENSLKLISESDLFFPIYSDNNLTNWELAGQTCRLYDTVNSVLSQRDPNKRKSMNYLTNCITDGENKRNVVTSMVESNNYYNYSYVSKVAPYDKRNNNQKDYYEFSYCNIQRGLKEMPKEEDEQQTKNKDSFRNLETVEFQPSETIPSKFRKTTYYSIKLSTTEKGRDMFKYWNEYVQKYFRYNDNREELKEELGTLVSTYEHGWYSDSDSGDDL